MAAIARKQHLGAFLLPMRQGKGPISAKTLPRLQVEGLPEPIFCNRGQSGIGQRGIAGAYRFFLISVEVMYKMGAAIWLNRLGYKFEKVNLV